VARTRPQQSTREREQAKLSPVVKVTYAPEPGAREQLIELLAELLDRGRA
jgi:hypothetical protein